MAAAERGVEWWHMRIAMSQRFCGDLPAVRDWPFRDQLEAHIALDAVEDMEALYRPDLKE